MSVISVTKTWSKAGGSVTSEKFDPNEPQWTFTDGYQILLDTPDDNGFRVVNEAIALGLPNIGTQYNPQVNAFVKTITPTRVSPILWDATVAYQGINIEIADGAVEVEWGDVTTTEPIDRDWNGRAIVTANNEQVEGLSLDVADQICVIRRKFYQINTYAIRAYRRATNSDTFLGWPPGTVRLIGFSAKNAFYYSGAQELWDVTARFQFREPFNGTTAAQAWYKRWRHEGLLVRDGGTIRRALDDQGQELTKPVLLKNNGEQETNADNAIFKHTQVYGSLPYSALGLV